MPLTIGTTARPGRAKENRTGSWRVFLPVYDHALCSKCGLCQKICPEGCVRDAGDGMFEPDYTYCKGCGLCSEECPKKAITMKQEEK